MAQAQPQQERRLVAARSAVRRAAANGSQPPRRHPASRPSRSRGKTLTRRQRAPAEPGRADRREARRRPDGPGRRRLPGAAARRGPGRPPSPRTRASRSSTAPTARPASCATIIYDWPRTDRPMIDERKAGRRRRHARRQRPPADAVGDAREHAAIGRTGPRNTSARTEALGQGDRRPPRCRSSGSACRPSSRRR